MKYLDKIKRGGKIDIKYNGTVQNGVAHGKGTMIFNGSRKFKGFFNNGKGFGKTHGIPVYNDGIPIVDNSPNFYEGYVNNNGLPHGSGILTSSSVKIVYSGEFKDGKYDGYGKLTVNDTEMTSQFNNGKAVKSLYNDNVNVADKVQKIMMKYLEEANKVNETVCDSCDTYIGDYPTGKGVLKFKNGDTYIGEYPSGKGTMKFKNGDVYEGEYPTGKGTMTFENGDKRIVKLQNGKQTMSFLKKKVNGEQVDEIETNVNVEKVDEIEKNVNGEQVDEIQKKVKQIKEELNKINIDQLSVCSKSDYKKLKSLLEQEDLTNEMLKKAEILLTSIQAPQSRSLGIKELAGVAGVAGLSYYLYNKFKKSSKCRAKSSSSKSSSRKSTRRSKHSEQSSLS